MAAYTTIDDPTIYFNTSLWTANGSAKTISGVGFQPDLLWTKCRSNSYSHIWVDSVRGITKQIKSDSNAAEATDAQGVTAFNSDGYVLGTQDEFANNGNTFVGWSWKEAATAGFDIVSYTGNGSNRTISHSLSAVPKIMIVKTRSNTSSWQVYHVSIGNTKFLELSGTTAEQTASNRWQDTTPTSSVFSIGTDAAINENGTTYINYLFSEKQGYSKFGSYVGNANADAPFIFTEFRPAWFMFKDTESTTSWIIKDNKRLGYNGIVPHLQANTGDTENTDGWSEVDFLSNGIKLRNADNSMNKSGSKFIYMAFAESPFVNSNGVPNNAR